MAKEKDIRCFIVFGSFMLFLMVLKYGEDNTKVLETLLSLTVKWLKPLQIDFVFLSPRFKPWAIMNNMNLCNRFNDLKLSFLIYFKFGLY